ncbi:hypothetical protein LOK49_LG02G03373 [Camellia lanceoleosa]|uniref:Uncharacterized protein n=1 Tax=Camellia lanceoleosa TaxID=1840588 RepID=A0ACC0IRH8_9ERIC|nr:hypothetical protein LOK49_LG02G03373 [Camellia lanceoleosa]
MKMLTRQTIHFKLTIQDFYQTVTELHTSVHYLSIPINKNTYNYELQAKHNELSRFRTRRELGTSLRISFDWKRVECSLAINGFALNDEERKKRGHPFLGDG